MSQSELTAFFDKLEHIAVSSGKLVRVLYIVLSVVVTSAFSAGVALTNNSNRLSNLETYGSKSLQDHERRQAADTLAQTQAMAELKTTVHDLSVTVKELAKEVRELGKGR